MHSEKHLHKDPSPFTPISTLSIIPISFFQQKLQRPLRDQSEIFHRLPKRIFFKVQRAQDNFTFSQIRVASPSSSSFLVSVPLFPQPVYPLCGLIVLSSFPLSPGQFSFSPQRPTGSPEPYEPRGSARGTASGTQDDRQRSLESRVDRNGFHSPRLGSSSCSTASRRSDEPAAGRCAANDRERNSKVSRPGSRASVRRPRPEPLETRRSRGISGIRRFAAWNTSISREDEGSVKDPGMLSVV